MKKKLLSLFMACAMILALAVPAFADTSYYDYPESPSTDLTQTINIAARTFVPTVRLFLPNFTGDSVVLNPYKIAYTGEGNALNAQDVGDTTDPQGDAYKQVISPVYAIKNGTDVKLNFAVAATGTVEGEMSFSNDYVSLTETAKKAHLTIVFGKRSETAPTITTTTTQALDGSLTGQYETITLKATETKSNSDVKYLDAASENSPNYLKFQFQGDLTRKPTKGWTADDKFSVTVTFTFTPESKADAAATKDESATALAFADASLADKEYTLSPTASADIEVAAAAFVVNETDPKWSVISGPLTASISGTAPANKLKIAKEAQKDIPKDGASHDYVFVLGCVDKNGMPRTVEATIKLKRAAS